jgi:hypothetical protein
MRAALVWGLLLVLAGGVRAQEPQRPVLTPHGLVTIQWDYPLDEPLTHVGFLIESCVMEGAACTMVARWSTTPLTLSQAVMLPPPGVTKCWQVRTLGAVATSEPSARICRTAP